MRHVDFPTLPALMCVALANAHAGCSPFMAASGPAAVGSGDSAGSVDDGADQADVGAAEGTSLIIGGTVTAAFPAVGMVNFTLDQSSNICTGTLIAPGKVLTAAHCARGDSAGSNGGSFDTSAWTFFWTDNAGQHRTQSTHIDVDPNWKVISNDDISTTDQSSDIAVITLAQIPGVDAMPFVSLQPGRGAGVTLVGYGATYDPNDQDRAGDGAGVKRTVYTWIDTVDMSNRIISWGSPSAGTCRGDSGGPVLASISDDGKTLAIIATVSAGPGGCTSTAGPLILGNSSWLSSFIHLPSVLPGNSAGQIEACLF